MTNTCAIELPRDVETMFLSGEHPADIAGRKAIRILPPEVAGPSPFFARPSGSEIRQREWLQTAFLSLRMTTKSAEGGGGNA